MEILRLDKYWATFTSACRSTGYRSSGIKHVEPGWRRASPKHQHLRRRRRGKSWMGQRAEWETNYEVLCVTHSPEVQQHKTDNCIFNNSFFFWLIRMLCLTSTMFDRISSGCWLGVLSIPRWASLPLRDLTKCLTRRSGFQHRPSKIKQPVK